MRRRSIYILVFVSISGALLIYNVVIPLATATPTACALTFADLTVTTSDFAATAGPSAS